MLSFSRILDDLYRNTVSRRGVLAAGRNAAAATMMPHRLDAAVKRTDNEFLDTPPLLTGRSSLNEVASNRLFGALASADSTLPSRDYYRAEARSAFPDRTKHRSRFPARTALSDGSFAALI
jgi:hypothetical protein